MELFEIKDNIHAICNSEKTRYGFRHLATLMVNESEHSTTKECYYNRTWESYEFESVLRNLLSKVSDSILTQQEKDQFLKTREKISTDKVNSMFNSVAMVAQLGEVFSNTTKESNDWKTRMLKAGLTGLDIPKDWDTLDENTKQERLDKVIEFAKTGDKHDTE